MIYKNFVWIYLLTCLSLASTAQVSNWSQLLSTDLEGGDVRAYLNHNNVVYAGTRGGIFKSLDKGVQWTYCSNGLATGNAPEINSLAVLNDTLFVATVYGMAESADGGANWVACADAGGKRQYIDKIVVMNGGLFVVSQNTLSEWKVFRSDDYGKTWNSGTQVFASRPRLHKVRNNFIFVTMDDSIYTTIDGMSFTNMGATNMQPGAQLDYLCGDSSVSDPYIYAVVNYAKIMRLNIVTKAWDELVNKVPASELYTLYYFNSKLIVCGVKYNPSFNPGIYISNDLGFNWTPLTAPFGVKYPLMQNIIWLGGNELMANFYYENFYSSNAGLNWNKRTTGMYAGKATGTISSGNTLFTAYTHEGILRSTDFGLNWLPANTGMNSSIIFAQDIYKTRNRLYATAQYSLGDSVFLFSSVNDGLSWSRCTLPVGVKLFDIIGSNDTTLFIKNRTQSNYFVFRSVDNGNTWVSMQNKLPTVYTQGGGSITSITGARDTIVTMGMDAFKVYKIYYSTDNGNTFTPANNGIPSAVNTSVLRILPGVSYFIAIVRNGNDSVKYFINSAWVNAKGLNLPEEPRLFVVDQIGNRMFAATNGGVYVSADYGYRWVYVDKGPNGGVAINRFTGAGPYLFASTDNNGIWRNTLQVNISPVAPTNNDLLVYPNPAGNELNFSAGISWSGDISCELFDLSGRLVKTISNTTGKIMSVDVSNLAKGMYFYRVNSGDMNLSGKVLIAR